MPVWQLGQAATVTDDWNSVDVVLLDCIARRGTRGADLKCMFYEADYINRMVYHRAEMESALQKLLGAGLARKTEDGFAIAGSGGEPLPGKRQGSSDPHMG